MSVLCIIFKRTGCEEVLGRVEFALPSFHAYGHKPQCQVSTAQLTWKCIHMLYIGLLVSLGPIRCTGLGLSDGEVMERLWSYLRRFSRMTKEMRPSHRTDILCHALIYYGMKTKQKLGEIPG